MKSLIEVTNVHILKPFFSFQENMVVSKKFYSPVKQVFGKHYVKCRSSCSQMLFKGGAVKYFAKFTRKTLC